MSSLGKLAALLQQAPLELTAEDIADALWLATLTGPVELRPAPSVADPRDPVALDAPPPPAGPDPGPSDQPRVPPATGAGAAEAVLPTEHVAAASIPFRSPTAAAIPDALGLGRALRPLRRRVPSRIRAVLDENATATRIADSIMPGPDRNAHGLWLPVLRPAMSRWLDLELVVEDSPSMRLWSRQVAELELLLQFNGAFRNTYPWRLHSDGPIRLFSGRDRSTRAARDHRELLDSSGRRAIVIVSDCVSAAWYDGSLAAWLAAWTRRGPVAVLQVLPQRLWTRTALRRGLPAMFRAAAPAASNRRLAATYIAASPAPGDDVIPLPVMTLEPGSIAAWARTVAGLSATIEGVALPGRGRPSDGAARIARARPTAAARVARFRETSTEPARRLASCLATVPVTLPIIRLVRAAAVPEAGDSDLAELFLGGLLREIVADDHPDRVEYDFHDGVRERLLDFVPTDRALHVLDEVSAYIEPRLGHTRDFPARLTAVTGTGPSFAQRHRSFALLAAHVFARLGDPWIEYAAQLQQHAGAPRPGTAAPAAASARFLDDAAAQYERIRREQPAGRERSAILDALIEGVVDRVRGHAVDPAVLIRLYATGQDGARAVALGAWTVAPDRALATAVSHALGAPRSRFELWWALRAVRALLSQLGPLHAEPGVAAVLDQLADPKSLLNQLPDGASLRQAEAVVDEFQRVIGVSSARSWIDAGIGRQGTGRCVAILGSDPPGTHRRFCRALGERLAACGWKIVAGEGDHVGPEVIESFLAADGPAGEAILYTPNMFDSNDSMRRHMIASADAAVVIAGGRGTTAERDLARSEDLPVVAVGFTGGTAAQTAAEAVDDPDDDGVVAELRRLLDTPQDPSFSAEIAVRLLHLEVRDRPRPKLQVGDFRLHDVDGIRQWLVAADRARDDEILDLVNVFATRRQRTWLVAMPGRVLCVLDDLDTRRKGRLVQFTEIPEQLVPVGARANDLETGILRLGKRRDWHYSTALFPEPGELVARVNALLAIARSAQRIADQLADRPDDANVDRGPGAALPFPVIPVAVEGPAAAPVLDALRGVRGLELVTARPDARSRARFTIVADGSSLVMLEDGAPCAFPLADDRDGRATLAARLATWARAEAVRNLVTQDLPADAIDVAWGRIDEEGGWRRPLRSGARIHADDRIYVTFSNRSDRPLYVGVFDIGVAGSTTLLSATFPRGYRLGPGESATLGALDRDDAPRDLYMLWPDDCPATSPRRESLIVVAATSWTDFSLLESRNLATRNLGANRLEVVLDQIREPGVRDLGSRGSDPEGFCVRRIDFELSPAPRGKPVSEALPPSVAVPDDQRRRETAPDPGDDAGTDFGLVIAIEHYPRFRWLSGAIEDATRFHEWLCDPAGGGVDTENARLLSSRSDSPSPTQEDIDAHLVELWLRAEAIPRARRLYFYVRGRAGTPSADSDDITLLLSRWSLARWSRELTRQALSIDAYRTRLSAGPFEEVVLFLDVDRSLTGSVMGSPPTFRFPDRPVTAARAFVACAAAADRPAFEGSEGNREPGVLTRTLLQILRSAVRLTAADLKRELEHAMTLGGSRVDVINGLQDNAFFVTPRGSPRLMVEFERARGRVELRDGHMQIVAAHDAGAGPWELSLPPGLYRLEDESGQFLLVDLYLQNVHVTF